MITIFFLHSAIILCSARDAHHRDTYAAAVDEHGWIRLMISFAVVWGREEKRNNAKGKQYKNQMYSENFLPLRQLSVVRTLSPDMRSK